MKLIIIVFCLLINQLQAQMLHLSLVDNSVNVKNDSLYYKYRFQNTGNLTLALYNTKYGDFDMFGIDHIISTNIKIRITPLPRLLIDVYNNENKLPKLIFHTFDHKIPKDVYNLGKYIILKPNESKEYDFAISLLNRGMVKGEYKLQLVYFCNSYYNNEYLKAKKKNDSLINSVMFKGIEKSNVVKFNYTSK